MRDTMIVGDPASPWSITDAAELYSVLRWGNGFFSIQPDGHVHVHPEKDPQRSIDLKNLVVQLQDRGLCLPILLRFNASPCTTTTGLRNPGPDPVGSGRSAHQVSPCATSTTHSAPGYDGRLPTRTDRLVVSAGRRHGSSPPSPRPGRVGRDTQSAPLRTTDCGTSSPDARGVRPRGTRRRAGRRPSSYQRYNRAVRASQGGGVHVR